MKMPIRIKKHRVFSLLSSGPCRKTRREPSFVGPNALGAFKMTRAGFEMEIGSIWSPRLAMTVIAGLFCSSRRVFHRLASESKLCFSTRDKPTWEIIENLELILETGLPVKLS